MTAADLARQLEERELRARRPTNLWRDTLGEILRQRSAIAGLAILGVILFCAVFANVIAPHDPEVPIRGVGAERLTGPCIHLLGCPDTQQQFLMGVDQNGRDVFSRVVFGARVSLQVGIVTVGMAILVGTLIGSIAGYVGGWVDNIFMRVMDVLLAFPALVLAIGTRADPTPAAIMIIVAWSTGVVADVYRLRDLGIVEQLERSAVNAPAFQLSITALGLIAAAMYWSGHDRLVGWSAT